MHISIFSKEAELIIEIEDNGIGREKAKELGTGGTGMGFFIMKKMALHLNKQNTKSIKWNITDLKDSNENACGMLVKIVIPENFIYYDKTN